MELALADLGAVAITALQGHDDGETLRVTGPEALLPAQQVAIVAGIDLDGLGRYRGLVVRAAHERSGRDAGGGGRAQHFAADDARGARDGDH